MKYFYAFETCTLWREKKLSKKEIRAFESQYGKLLKKK